MTFRGHLKNLTGSASLAGSAPPAGSPLTRWQDSAREETGLGGKLSV